MRTDHTNPSKGLGRATLALVTATLLASVSVAVAPTPAAAFNIEGFIRGAIAHGYGGARVSGGHHGRIHEASRRSRHDEDDDAPPSDVPPAKQDISPPPRDSGRAMSPPVDSAKPAMASRTYAEEPSFTPSR